MSYPDPNNPYASSQYGVQSTQSPQTTPQNLPVLVLVVAILELIWLSFRVLLVLLGMAGLAAAPDSALVRETGIFEVGTGVLMILFGFPAAIGMLTKQRWAVIAAVLKIIATLGSCAVGVWQSTYPEAIPPGAEKELVMMGVMMGVAFRIALIVLFGVGVFMFHNWIVNQQGVAKLHLSNNDWQTEG